MSTTIFDAHCHVFNGSILRDLIHIDTGLPKSIRPKSEIGSWWNYMKEIAEALANSQKTNNKFVLTALKNGFPDVDSFATVPLMMDINFMHDNPLKATDIVSNGDLVFESNIQNQINGLMKLSYKGNCYPFFCVDPRRKGIIDAILNGQYITRKSGGFYGLKLYPRLGYHPMSDKLPQLYTYCANNNIPITTHCSAGGFPPWSTPSGSFCDPLNFIPALEKNPNLIIDFAHFGNGNLQWSNSIINLMKAYPNIYSDLACYTGDDDLIKFKKKFWNKDNPDIELIKSRTMYGSDFDVFYFTETGIDMNEYIQAFKDEFSIYELNTMMSVLPSKFLGI